uniref:Uncharacterized protein n=1 Tax=Cafeteria roenbergensis TaxID=33653 RepID=A0A7S0JRA5_CAFRO|mmetsp:Transcript_14704/g.55415  ORF Transcript_14704/g.55415 Transcript_14704/m.55415 type:complete len:117 (+) Transcript_14704:136-486(+)
MDGICRPPALVVPPVRDFGTFELRQQQPSEAAAASLQGTPTSFGSKDSGAASGGWVVRRGARPAPPLRVGPATTPAARTPGELSTLGSSRQTLDLTDEGEATPLGGLSTSVLDREE